MTDENVETRGDDRVDLITGDTNKDGKPDLWVSDTDGDGKADLFQFDTDGDGKVDITMVDLDQDGKPDRVVSGDGGPAPSCRPVRDRVNLPGESAGLCHAPCIERMASQISPHRITVAGCPAPPRVGPPGAAATAIASGWPEASIRGADLEHVVADVHEHESPATSPLGARLSSTARCAWASCSARTAFWPAVPALALP